MDENPIDSTELTFSIQIEYIPSHNCYPWNELQLSIEYLLSSIEIEIKSVTNRNYTGNGSGSFSIQYPYTALFQSGYMYEVSIASHKVW